MNNYSPFRQLSFVALVVLLFHSGSSNAQPAGGKWAAVSQLPILTNARLVFADSLVGYYIGQDTGYVTKDGALTWTQLTFGDKATPSPAYLFALSHTTVMSFQRRRLDGTPVPGVMISTDMGATWTVISTKTIPNKVSALTMWNANDGFRIWLDDKTSKDTCAVTHDGGKTFTDIRGDAVLEKYISKLQDGTYSIQSAWSDMTNGVIVVSGKSNTAAYPILITSDGGRSWHAQYLKFKGDSTLKLAYPYVYPGTGSIWVVPAVPAQAQFFYYSSDYGTTWVTTDTLVRTGQYPPAVFNLAPVSPTASWVVLASDADHYDLSRAVIDYKDISGKWVLSTYLPGNQKSYWYISDIQFADQNHGWATAEKKSNQAGNTVTVDTEFFYQFRSTPQNSVQQNGEFSSLRSIPNPASSIIHFEGFMNGEQIEEVQITSILGSRISRTIERRNSGIELDISGLPQGSYMVSIRTNLRKENVPVLVVK